MVFFGTQGQSNSEVKCPIWLEFKIVRDFMAVLVTCKFEDDSIKREAAVLQTFSPI